MSTRSQSEQHVSYAAVDDIIPSIAEVTLDDDVIDRPVMRNRWVLANCRFVVELFHNIVVYKCSNNNSVLTRRLTFECHVWTCIYFLTAYIVATSPDCFGHMYNGFLLSLQPINIMKCRHCSLHRGGSTITGQHATPFLALPLESTVVLLSFFFLLTPNCPSRDQAPRLDNKVSHQQAEPQLSLVTYSHNY